MLYEDYDSYKFLAESRIGQIIYYLLTWPVRVQESFLAVDN